MKIRTYKLSQMDAGDFTLAGYSVAGEESIIIAPELDVCFDIGKCPREALNINNVLLSHGHMDHVAGMAYYFAQRDFQGMPVGTAVVPADLVEPLIRLMNAWGEVEGHVPPYRFVGMRIGEEYQILAYTEKGMANLKVLLELAGDRSCEDVVRLIGEELKECLEIRVDVEAVAPGALNRSEYKAKRFVDRREK